MMSRKHIEERANELTEVYSEPPIPVYEIIRSQGVAVYEATFKEGYTGLHGFCDFVDDAIYLNKADHPIQQIVTAAHELGHWILHREDYKRDNKRYAFFPKKSESELGGNEEEEADAEFFASRLLVPRSLLLLYVPHNSVAVLANAFDVPRAMMERRVKD